jgi:hypothetical protein
MTAMTKLTALSILIAGAFHVQAQIPRNTLAITSPATGTAVRPGDYVHVTVTQKASSGFVAVQQVFVSGDSLGRSAAQGAPFQFNFQVPANTPPGEHLLYAVGTNAGSHGPDAVSDPIVISVSRRDRPLRLVAEPGVLALGLNPAGAPGDSSAALRLYYVYADGSRSPVPAKTAGRDTVRFSTAYGYAAVDAYGVVTPKRAGSDEVRIECLACSSATAPRAVSVQVADQPIYAPQKSLSAAASGGSFQVDVYTQGLTYQIDGEAWARGGMTLTLDHRHWSSTIAVDRNPSPQARTGTVRFTLPSGQSQSVTIYQPGTP